MANTISKPRLYDLWVTRGVSWTQAELETGIKGEVLAELAIHWGIPVPIRDDTFLGKRKILPLKEKSCEAVTS